MRTKVVVSAGLVALLALAGCKETQMSDMEKDACGASAYRSLIGQDRAAVTEAGLISGPDIRIIGPGSMVTMDHRPDRLNIELDADDKVIAVRCG